MIDRDITCPYCGEWVTVTEDDVDQEIECQECGGPLVVVMDLEGLDLREAEDWSERTTSAD